MTTSLYFLRAVTLTLGCLFAKQELKYLSFDCLEGRHIVVGIR